MPLLFAVAALAVAAASLSPAEAQTERDACDWDGAFSSPAHHTFITAFAVLDDGSGPALYAGGSFIEETEGTPVAGNLAKWDGTEWAVLGWGLPAEASEFIVLDDGIAPTLYAGMEAIFSGGATFAEWTGDEWSFLTYGNPYSSVRSLAVFDDGAGPALFGGIDYGGGEPVVVARWEEEDWEPIGHLSIPNQWSSVNAIAVFDDGSGDALYAAGNFTEADGVAANYIVRWNGEQWMPLGEGLNGPPQALAVVDTGSGPALYVGGAFTMAGGEPANHVARWDGSNWTSLGSGTNLPIRTLSAIDGSQAQSLVAGGPFSEAGEFPASRIAQWDGLGWSPLGVGLDGHIRAIEVFDDGSGNALYVGGAFTEVGGRSTNGVARWTCAPAVKAEGDPKVANLHLSTFPNPASYAATIAFEAPEAGPVRLAVYDILGREVAVVKDGELPAGRHSFEWQTRGVAPGMYVVRVQTAIASTSRRIVVMR